MSDLMLIVQGDNTVWIDADSLIQYFRAAEAQGKELALSMFTQDPVSYAAAMATSDAFRQVADSLTVTCVQASTTMGERRGSR
jgi:hypothetical protein